MLRAIGSIEAGATGLDRALQDAAHLIRLGVRAPRLAEHAGAKREFGYQQTYAPPEQLESHAIFSLMSSRRAAGVDASSPQDSGATAG
jgi:hypothetical protein